MVKKTGLVLMVALYIGGGINHFIHPDGYLEIIPPYLPWHEFINAASGFLEILLGLLLIFKKTRPAAACGVIILLGLFIPAHVFMIRRGGCMGVHICIPAWAAWVRLFPLQFLLMAWAWWQRK